MFKYSLTVVLQYPFNLCLSLCYPGFAGTGAEDTDAIYEPPELVDALYDVPAQDGAGKALSYHAP